MRLLLHLFTHILHLFQNLRLVSVHLQTYICRANLNKCHNKCKQMPQQMRTNANKCEQMPQQMQTNATTNATTNANKCHDKCKQMQSFASENVSNICKIKCCNICISYLLGSRPLYIDRVVLWDKVNLSQSSRCFPCLSVHFAP